MPEVRDESGDPMASVHANLMGTQQVQIPSRAQGNLTVSLGDQSSDYRILVWHRQRQSPLINADDVPPGSGKDTPTR